MYLPISFALVGFLLISVLFVLWGRRRKSYSIRQSRAINPLYRTIAVSLICVPLFLVTVASFIPGVSEWVVDVLHIPLINNAINVPNNNITDPNFGADYQIAEYPVYDEWYNGYRRTFKVTNHEKFIEKITSLDAFMRTYTHDLLVFYIFSESENSYFFLVYNQSTGEFLFTSAVVWFPKIGYEDYIPLIPCDFFTNNQYIPVVTDVFTSTTGYSWDEIVEFYLPFGESIITIDDLQQTIYFVNPITGHEFRMVYEDSSISITTRDS